MQATIWKLALKVADVQDVVLPLGSEVLCAREQDVDICIWFRCDPAQKAKSQITIAICGTGHPAPTSDQAKYLGTAFLGALVFHVFERIVSSPFGTQSKEDAANAR